LNLILSCFGRDYAERLMAASICHAILFHFCSLSEQVILMTASSRNNASLVFIQR